MGELLKSINNCFERIIVRWSKVLLKQNQSILGNLKEERKYYI
jgi:hypothetical protein